MNYFGFGSRPATPVQGIRLCLNLALTSIEKRKPTGDEAARLLALLRHAKDQGSKAVAQMWMSPEMQDFRLPSPLTLKRRPLEVSLALRAVDACARAADAAESGDEVRAWRCIAAAALSLGSSLVLGMQGATRSAGANKAHSEDKSAKEQAFQWLEGNASRFANMTQMAAALEREVGYSDKTRYNWVRSWRAANK